MGVGRGDPNVPFILFKTVAAKMVFRYLKSTYLNTCYDKLILFKII